MSVITLLSVRWSPAAIDLSHRSERADGEVSVHSLMLVRSGEFLPNYRSTQGEELVVTHLQAAPIA